MLVHKLIKFSFLKIVYLVYQGVRCSKKGNDALPCLKIHVQYVIKVHIIPVLGHCSHKPTLNFYTVPCFQLENVKIYNYKQFPFNLFDIVFNEALSLFIRINCYYMK